MYKIHGHCRNVELLKNKMLLVSVYTRIKQLVKSCYMYYEIVLSDDKNNIYIFFNQHIFSVCIAASVLSVLLRHIHVYFASLSA